MKKYLVIAIVLIVIASSFIILFKDNKHKIVSYDEALALGEEKYMVFLWFVNGAFNNDEYYVNSKVLNKENYPFICDFKKSKTKCYVKNFYDTFKKIFASNVSLEKVYSDGISDISYQLNDKDVLFNIGLSCSLNKMNSKHNLEVKQIDRDIIIYLISFEDDGTSKSHKFNREFVLKYENNLWKISKAYYRDRCRMDYNIE